VEVLQITEGPLIRAVDRHVHIHEPRLAPQSVALVVKKLITNAGIPGDHTGVPERSTMAQTGHRFLATQRKYIREGSPFLENVGGKVGP